MTTTTLQKELKKIVRKHERLSEELKRILVSVEKRGVDLPYGDWELTSSTKKRIERASRALAAEKGVVLKNEVELRKFFREMKHDR